MKYLSTLLTMATVFGLATTPGCNTRTEAEMGKKCELSESDKLDDRVTEINIRYITNDAESYTCKRVSVSATPISIELQSRGRTNLYFVLGVEKNTVTVLYESESGDRKKLTKMCAELKAAKEIEQYVTVQGRFNGSQIDAEYLIINGTIYTEKETEKKE
ncbi:hypothetical protein HOK51_04130 [Candidatus Woesearchaeota archaeon]|jgi:hypothetical protein|nr:hypothetical protein [Candidatus Woesearchaeota archaeon]MBT6519010.1 hypothetical protein [Candidatus Woesearchaeota archaeon]MBT7368791.1 hypothetical protein [Candidatus Woesearchaeota archaeon]